MILIDKIVSINKLSLRMCFFLYIIFRSITLYMIQLSLSRSIILYLIQLSLYTYILRLSHIFNLPNCTRAILIQTDRSSLPSSLISLQFVCAAAVWHPHTLHTHTHYTHTLTHAPRRLI